MISSVFVGLLIALAFSEMISPVRHELRSRQGDLLGTACLLVIFFSTTLRFFIGNQLHLISKELAVLPGKLWLTDFCIIILQCTLLVFSGGVCSVEETHLARVNLIQLQLAILAIDILWVVLIQFALGQRFSSWQRPEVCFEWVRINLFVFFTTLLLHFVFQSWSSHAFLYIVTALNLAAFLLDVYYCDKYDIL